MSQPRPMIERAMPLIDMEIERGGDGRTVTAYAATFGTPYEVMDFDGHYDEIINRAAFDRMLARGLGAVQVLYNHGRTIWGTPSEKFSTTLGVPVEVRAEPKGLLTRTRYNRTPFADEVLEMIRNGDIRGQSFRGPIFESKSRGAGGNGRKVIERMALGLKEYGPTPFPVNAGAEVLALRSQLIVEQIRDLSPEERAEALRLLAEAGDDPPEEPDGTLPPPPDGQPSPEEEPEQPADEDDPPAPAGPSNELLEARQRQRRRRNAA